MAWLITTPYRRSRPVAHRASNEKGQDQGLDALHYRDFMTLVRGPQRIKPVFHGQLPPHGAVVHALDVNNLRGSWGVRGCLHAFLPSGPASMWCHEGRRIALTAQTRS
jgi:hypothetical protein